MSGSFRTRLTIAFVLTTAFVTETHAQRGNQSVMFGKALASNGRVFAISQSSPEPRTLFLFSANRQSAKFLGPLTAPANARSERFGETIAMNSSSLIVGDPRASSGVGAVLVYPVSRSGRVNVKSLQGLGPDVAYRRGQFGSAIACSDDFIAVSAPDASLPGQASGIVFLFAKQRGGYKPAQKLTAGGPADEAVQFGRSLALDDKLLVVGVPLATNNRRGEVRIFPRSGKLYADKPALILADSAKPYGSYGWLVKMSPDWLVVSALEESSNYDGAVYAYRRNKDGSVDKASKVQLKVPTGAATAKDSFGGAVALLDSHLFVSLTTPSTSGKVLVYDLEKASPGVYDKVLQTLEPPQRSQPDQFGESIAVNGKNVLIGSPPPLSSKPIPGAAYVFSPDKKGMYSVTAGIDPKNGVQTPR